MAQSIAIFTVLLSGSVSAFTGYIASRFSQRQQQRHTEDVYRLAVATEIRTLNGRLARYDELLRSQILAGKVSNGRLFKVLVPKGATAVFANNAASVGVFDTRTALRILRFYADVRTLQGHAQVVSKMGPAAGDDDVTIHQRLLRHARRQARGLVRRLRTRRRTPAFAPRLWPFRTLSAATRALLPHGRIMAALLLISCVMR
jgi:hypothetical protein